VVARKHFFRNHASVRVALGEDTFSGFAERRMMLRVNAGGATRSKEYAERLTRLQTSWWKRWLDVQAPFRWNLRRLQPGFTLDLGCGIGRTLEHLSGHGVGVDTNEYCVKAARARGFTAFTPDEFRRAPEFNRPGRFDSLLLAHVAEHMTEAEALSLLQEYESLVRPGGKLILLAPQEAGFRSDATHVELMDFERLTRISDRLGFQPDRAFSFPFPRWVGELFTYNEFVVVGTKVPSPL
jgi:SAM-dependent methyltransferase